VSADASPALPKDDLAVLAALSSEEYPCLDAVPTDEFDMKVPNGKAPKK
jgi:hypothetical protein